MGGPGHYGKTELRRLLDRTSQLFRRPADVGGLLIPVLWFGMDFKGAASKTRPSRIPPLGPEVAARVVSLTLADPPVETTHWTADLMAQASGISASAVRRIWKAHGLQPHRYRQFKLSNDPNFVDKLRDVVGLYVDPPAHAIVLSLDEKSQIQALDRTQPGLPLKKGRLGTMTHDYKRHGTTTLFAALNVLDGKQHAAPPPSGVHALPERDRGRGAGRQDGPRHPRQLRRPQAYQGPRLARPARALRLPLHANLMLLAQCGRGLLRQAVQAPLETRRLPLRRRPPARHQPLPRRDQRRTEALHMDRRPRQNHRRRQTRAPSVRFHPLACPCS